MRNELDKEVRVSWQVGRGKGHARGGGMGYVITRTMVVGVESEKESNTVGGSFGGSSQANVAPPQPSSPAQPPVSASGAGSVRSVQATNTRSVATSYESPHPGETYELSKVERYSVALFQSAPRWVFTLAKVPAQLLQSSSVEITARKIPFIAFSILETGRNPWSVRSW
jgi:hypothetical protein